MITMYRLMLYYLIFLVIWAAGLSFAEILPYATFDILGSALYLAFMCWAANKLFAKIFKVQTNPESPLISGLILSLIFGPFNLTSNILTLTLVGVAAMVSKYLVAWRGRHIFNPAGFGAVVAALILNQGASWWVGNSWMLPAVLVGGFLVLRKIRRYELVGAFLLVEITTLTLFAQSDVLSMLLNSSLIFFALVMLVEPLTSPPLKKWQIVYGGLVAVVGVTLLRLFSNIFYGLELSLLAGNIFSFLVSKNFRQALKLVGKQHMSHDVIAFKFEPWKKFPFAAGQYLEWTLSHPHPDSRGIRRYFTIASSPTEDTIMLATKFYEKPSSFKQALTKMEPGDEITVHDLSGEFVLPKDLGKKLVLIAGGIGITPFRSMAKWMIDVKEKRDIVLLFSNKTKEDIVFGDIFEKAESLGWKTVYVNIDRIGFIDEKLIKQKVKDWKERQFFVSGPEPMVESFEKLLYKMGLKKSQVKRDYFPGYTETHAIGQ